MSIQSLRYFFIYRIFCIVMLPLSMLHLSNAAIEHFSHILSEERNQPVLFSETLNSKVLVTSAIEDVDAVTVTDLSPVFDK